MIEYAFGFPVVAMVSQILVEGRIPGNDVMSLPLGLICITTALAKYL